MARLPEGLNHLNSAPYPPHRPISRQEARSLDRAATDEFSIPSFVLMEHASRGVAGVAASLVTPADDVLVLCGPGNNGGDGYGAARFLRSWGFRVRIARLSAEPPPPSDAGREYALALADGVPVEDAAAAPDRVQAALATGPALVIDAIFGTGTLRELRDPWLGWIQAVNQVGALRVAVDLPSGLDADTGDVSPVCVQADVTATMVAPKLGFARRPAAVGHVVEVDIGLPAALHGPFAAP